MKLNVEPRFKEACKAAKKEESIILTCVDGFITDAEALILRDALWYARNEGVSVQFVPADVKHKKSKKK